ncbi:hypothetical protein J2Z48_000939 [Croceifilum oryzae]|uniref:Uncharacterized protein n=1 Tax=Croceifilum oryzae TaxID=1553429 RepID=A0AAJ1WPR0_9BACL|nr:hypothetical protein [Croceifilum oryzae]MDQ0416772.1 hypothetical protein [Croceifilum oryzae]
MPAHSMGFAIESEEQFMEYLDLVVRTGEQTETSFGRKFSLVFSNGEEIVALMDEDHEVFHVNFHHRKGMASPVGIYEVDTNEEGELTGLTFGSMRPEEETNPESGMYPFVFQTGDMEVLEAFQQSETRNVEIAAFAHQVRCFATEEEFDQKQDPEVPLSSESLVPLGIFNDEVNDVLAPTILLNGVVTDVELLQNELSQAQYWQFTVQTVGAAYVVFASLDRVTEGEPAVGGIVSVEAWLTGRFV